MPLPLPQPLPLPSPLPQSLPQPLPQPLPLPQLLSPSALTLAPALATASALASALALASATASCQPASQLSQPASQPASSGTQCAPSAPKEHFGAKSSPFLLPPPLCHTCPTFLDGFGAPKCKSCSKTRFERPNAFWDPKNLQKRRTRMPKCGLCDFGAKRAPTAPLERLGAFGPLRTPINVGHVCKSAKVDFCNFIFHFFEK